MHFVPDEDELDDEEEEAEAQMYQETKFNFDDFLHRYVSAGIQTGTLEIWWLFFFRFANVKIVKALAILLRKFDENTNEVNHYVAKMLHRIAWDCKMPAMIFQASIFRDFQRILDSRHLEHKVDNKV